jgi:hypothetical protein
MRDGDVAEQREQATAAVTKGWTTTDTTRATLVARRVVVREARSVPIAGVVATRPAGPGGAYTDSGTSSRVAASRAASAKPRTHCCDAAVSYLAA